ncbi:MAG: glycosyltransferase [Candidatus Pacebacteria bacterium]|nr:glycosyltransferase [Candidatus Paceibacterota bacterium]
MKSILIATGIYPPELGGSGEYAKKLARIWSLEKKYKISVLTFADNSNSSLEEGFEVFRISRKSKFRHLNYLFACLRLGKRCDSILVLDNFSAAFPSALANLFLRKKMILRNGGDFLWEKAVESGVYFGIFRKYYESKLSFKEKFIKFLINFSMLRAHRIIFSGDFQKQVFLKNYSIDENKTLIIGNPYDLKVNSGILKINTEKDRVIIYAGRIMRLKNLDFVIDVFLKFKENHPDFKLKILGDGPYREILESRIKNLGGERVGIIIGPGLLKADFLNELKKSYLYILPSLSDMTPNSILDSFSVGTPFISTKETGFQYLLEGKAKTFDPFNSQELLDIFEYLAVDKNYQAYQKALEGIKYQVSWNDYSESILKLFNL